MLEGAEEELEQPCDQPVEPQREDAGENLEARHLFPQWTQLLPAHNHQVNFYQHFPIKELFMFTDHLLSAVDMICDHQPSASF